MTEKKELEALFRERGFGDFRWISAGDIAIAQWVRMKCQFGCPDYGKSVACPPNNPSVAECERFIGEYAEAVLFHFVKPAPEREERMKWSREINRGLLAIEREVFLRGHQKAFVLLMGSCPECQECVARPEDCRRPGSTRPTPEGLGVDLFATVRKAGYALEVLRDRSQPMNRYAILLIA